MKIAFVTNICPHYRVRTFEILASNFDIDFYFYSAGNDWYWQQKNGVYGGNFNYKYLPGFSIGGTRMTPTLVTDLWHENYDVYIKCINGRFALPVTYLISRLRQKPFILWTGIWSRIETPMHRLFFPLTRHIYQGADAIVCYGDHVRRYLQSEGILNSKIFTAHHAVDNSTYSKHIPDQEKIALLANLKIDPSKKIVLYIGRLEEAKGLNYLYKAYMSIKKDDSVLVIAGEGSLKSELEELVLSEKIDKSILFIGHIPPAKAVALYSVAYVSVLPSITTRLFKEPWGLVVNESFNQGVPIIATNAVGAVAGDLVIDNYNGLIVREKDVESLANALKRILDDEILRAYLSKNAMKIISGWNNERMVMGFQRAISSVIDGDK